MQGWYWPWDLKYLHIAYDHATRSSPCTFKRVVVAEPEGFAVPARLSDTPIAVAGAYNKERVSGCEGYMEN